PLILDEEYAFRAGVPKEWPHLVSALYAKRHRSPFFCHDGRQYRIFRLRPQSLASSRQLRHVRKGDAQTMKDVNQCLILAAGNGSRIASVSRGVPKPLVPLCGEPLLEHVMMSSLQAGIEKFVIVAGHRADAIRSWLNTRSHIGTPLTLIENLQYQKANGVSAL